MKTVALGELVDFYSGGTPTKSKPEFWQGDVPWFSAKDMKKPRLEDSTEHISNMVFSSTSLRKLPAGTIAMVVRGMILAHTVPIAVLDAEAAINQDLKALLPKREVDTSFLAAMLRAQHATILSQVSTAAHGTKKLDSRVLEELRIPYPPLPEQRRIAAILDHADALRCKRRQVLAHLDSLTQSIFHDMFGHLAATTPLSDMVEEFRYGTSNKAGQSGWPTLRIPNVIGGALDTNEVKTVIVTTAELERLKLRDGDLLFVRTNGNPDNVGRCAVFTHDAVAGAGRHSTDWIYASYLIRARLNGSVHPQFLAAYLRTHQGRRHLKGRAKTSAGQYNINIEGIGGVLVPAVEFPRQSEFVSLSSRVEAQARIVRAAAAAANELFASLQSRAFRGEL